MAVSTTTGRLDAMLSPTRVSTSPMRSLLSSRRHSTPTPEQIWKPGQRTKDGKRFSAFQHWQIHFKPLAPEDRPFAHEIRAHKEMAEYYETLCVFVSRNKKRGVKPDSIGELFPITEAARGGKLAQPENPRGKQRD